MKKLPSLLCSVLALLFVLASLFPTASAAQITAEEHLQKYNLDDMDDPVNTGTGNGYSGSNPLTERDPHYGWILGSFFVTGHTRTVSDENGNPIFLKTLGDTVTLWFHLEQDINALDGDETLTIAADNDGYDQYFKTEKTDFGRGTLIIRHKDYQNKWSEPVLYTDYLAAHAAGADTQVALFEEGDYEVALDYEIKDSPVDILGVSILPFYHDYRIFFRFSVRNGNCMVYPFDVVTGSELTDTSITENGFYLDLAKSRYLDIDIKKEVLTEGADGLVEDVRFNRPAKDGDQYTEEGIYTITVSNRYTGQETTKVIYVGTNNVLKAHVTTGLPISEINAQLASGAEVAEDGTIIPPPEESELSAPEEDQQAADTDPAPEEHAAERLSSAWPFAVIVLLCILLIISLFRRGGGGRYRRRF